VSDQLQWRPIETADQNEDFGRIILVCNVRFGRPYTIAKVQQRGDQFCYAGTYEPIDFSPKFWIERDVSVNPFHLPVPA
jgi:hypothetical protein